MAARNRFVRAAVVTALVLAAAVTVGLGSQVSLSPYTADSGDMPGCRYDLLTLRNAGYPGGYEVSGGTMAIVSDKHFFIGQACLA